MIEKLCNEEFQKLEMEYKSRMNEKLTSGNTFENFDDFENELGRKLFCEFKEKVYDFSKNKTETIIKIQIFEDKFTNLRKLSDFSNIFLGNYLENEYNKLFKSISENDCISLEKFNSTIDDIKKRYFLLSVNSSKKNQIWNDYQQKFKTLNIFLESKKPKLPERSTLSDYCWRGDESSSIYTRCMPKTTQHVQKKCSS